MLINALFWYWCVGITYTCWCTLLSSSRADECRVGEIRRASDATLTYVNICTREPLCSNLIQITINTYYKTTQSCSFLHEFEPAKKGHLYLKLYQYIKNSKQKKSIFSPFKKIMVWLNIVFHSLTHNHPLPYKFYYANTALCPERQSVSKVLFGSGTSFNLCLKKKYYGLRVKNNSNWIFLTNFRR